MNTQNWNAKKLLPLLILSGFVISCATKPPDIFVFHSLERETTIDTENGHTIVKPSPACMKEINEPSCGHGVAIMSGKEVYVGEKTKWKDKTWSEIKKDSILLPAKESYAPLAAYIINTCKALNCDTEVNKFRVQLDKVAPPDSGGFHP